MNETSSLQETIDGAVSPADSPDRATLPQTATAPQAVSTPQAASSNPGHFTFFGPAFFLYGVVYAICTYKNPSGVAFVLFMAATITVLCLTLRHLGKKPAKSSIFYFAAMGLLSVSTFCTDDGRLIFFNKLGIYLLTMSLLLSLFLETKQWNLGKWLGSIMQLTFGCLEELGTPFRDMSAHARAGKERNKKVWYVLLGLLITLPLAAIVLALLGSADAVFRQMLTNLFRDIAFGDIFNILFRTVFIYLASYLLISYLCKGRIREEMADHRKGEPLVAITISGVLTLIYLVFSLVQIIYLFLGNLNLPEGYTYASYAREGFFQLLAVGVLNLVLVLIFLALFKDSRVLKGILCLMSLCTFIMIASSALRMIIYIQYYYLTFLRILVLWTLLLLAFLFAGILIYILKDSFPLFRYSCLVMTLLYIGLSLAHPDALIARVNLYHAEGSAYAVENGAPAGDGFFRSTNLYNDFYSIDSLSADAAPIIWDYLRTAGDVPVYSYQNSPTLKESLTEKTKEWKEEESLRTFNLSRHLAIRAWEGK